MRRQSNVKDDTTQLKPHGFAGKAGERRTAADFVISSMIRVDARIFIINTKPVKDDKGLHYTQTVIKQIYPQNRTVLKDADTLGSIKAHLRACEWCYYGDKTKQ